MRLNTGKIEVVDGQQRLTTLIKFVKNEFKLQKLQKRSDLNGKLFKDLPDRDQDKVSDAAIRSIVIDGGTNHDLRYEIFERLNRGSMALNEQEIRNCAYRGPFCDLLAELEKDTTWRNVKGDDTPEPRFKEREMILRFFALSNRIEQYTGNLRKILNDYMGKYAPNEETKVAELGEIFRQTMQNVHAAFGEHSARLYTVENGALYEDGEWEQQFSISALDIQASALIGHPLTKIQAAAKSISEAYKFYLATAPQVRLSITQRPAGREATKTRWFGFKAVVHEIMSGITTQSGVIEPLFEARALCRTGYFTAAGASAGRILERHLKDLCNNHKPGMAPPKAMIAALNDMLRSANIYDENQHKRIQSLGGIRNRCSHAVSTPPSKEEVLELIDGVSGFLKSYPLK
jgi:hypothetical protein